MTEFKDSTRLVDHSKENRRYDNQYEFTTDSNFSQNYKTGLRHGCYQVGDNAALRCIIVWMCTVALVVFVALVAEIIGQDHSVKVGDIVTDHPECTKIGSQVLSQGGNAVDAAVAAGFCIAVAQPHLASLGGGGVLILHQIRKNTSTVVDFREVSPKNLVMERYLDNPLISQLGRGSIATPGFVAGLKYARDKYGTHQVRRYCCSWFDLVQMTAHLLEKGISAPSTWGNITSSLDLGKTSKQVKDFIEQGGYYSASSKFNKQMRGVLAALVHDQGSMYNGTLSRKILYDLKDQLSSEDLESYKAKERLPLTSEISNYQIITAPPPFSGAAVLGMLNSLFISDASYNRSSAQKLENIIERVLEEQELLGDPDEDGVDELVDQPDANFEKHGESLYQGESGQEIDPRDTFSTVDRTSYIINPDNARNWMSSRQKYGANRNSGDGFAEGSSIVVMDSQDNYVSMVLSLGSPFGSQFFSQGILMNNGLSSFDIQNDETEPTGRNFLKEQRRPLSYSAPAVVIDKEEACGTRLVLGSSSPEATAQVLKPFLVSGNNDILNLVSSPRLVHRNHEISGEPGYRAPQGSDVQMSSFPGYPVNILEKTQNRVNGVADRRGGDIQGRWRDLAPKYANK